MGRVQLFEIRLSQGRVVYSPGEPLAGAVHLRLGAPLPFRGGRGDPSGEWVVVFLPAVGRGSRKPCGQRALRLDSQAPGSPGYDGTLGARDRLFWEAYGGQGGAGSSVAQSFRICPVLCSPPRTESVRGPKCLFTMPRQPWR